MNRPWLLLDATGLCHRAWHVDQMRAFNFGGRPTGVIYGLLRDIQILQERFDTPNIAFCFDSGDSLRKSIYPKYKANRTREGKAALYTQIDQLKGCLGDIGFASIYWLEGYEADDWMAFLANVTFKDHEVVLVTRDHDMNQLLTEDNRVMAYDPQCKNYYTYEMFCEQWPGFVPEDLPKIMALTGCKTDNIEGIRGVGDITAMKILKGEKISDIITGRWRKFCDEGKYELNRKLIQLPWPGLEELHSVTRIQKDRVSQGAWNVVCAKFGLESLIPKCPRES